MFTTGDDAIALKSGRDQDGWRVGKPSKNVVIRNCKADTTLHGMAFGSEMSGGIEHIYVQHFAILNVDQYALQFKANKDRGGYIRNISIDNMTFDTVMKAIFFTNDYHSYAGGDKKVKLSTSILNPDGEELEQKDLEKDITAGTLAEVSQLFTGINNPKLWSPADRNLYSVLSKVYVDNRLVDEYVSPLGFRFFHWDYDADYFTI